MSSTPLLVLGTTRFSIEIACVARESGFVVAGFVENLDPALSVESLEGKPVYWIDDVGALAGDHVAVCGLGTTRRSAFTDEAAERGLRFATVVHPTAQIGAESVLGEGTIVGPGSIVASHTTLGRHVLVNRGCLVGHHTAVGDHVSIQSGANVAGSCVVGTGTFVAMGAVVVDHITVGAGCVVGAGAVVVEDVPDNVQVVGVPARIVKTGIDGR